MGKAKALRRLSIPIRAKREKNFSPRVELPFNSNSSKKTNYYLPETECIVQNKNKLFPNYYSPNLLNFRLSSKSVTIIIEHSA